MDKAIQICAKELEDYFSKFSSAVIAYSGGVDSALLAYAAHRALGERMTAAIADSPSLARREYNSALGFAKDNNIPLQVVHTKEMEDPFYLANKGNRCYYCKKALFEQLRKFCIKLEESSPESSCRIFYGANLDDLGDHRPGIRAAREASILAPYVDLGFDKKTIRALCKFYNLEIAEKPAMPCTSSRLAYGQEVTEEKLSQVESAEDFLYGLGLQVFRVRHHGDTARIEVPPEDFQIILENREKISKKFHELGFSFVSMDIDGFKSGSLNTVL
jgi:uncharacterized protein